MRAERRTPWRILAALACSLACAIATATPARTPIAGDVAPDYVGRARDRRPVSLASYAGKVVVVSFWTSWCAPCRQELPVLDNLQRAGKGAIQVVAVNCEDRDQFVRILDVLKGFAVQFVSDADRRAQQAYGVTGFPHMVIIGRDGTIVRVHSGYGDGVIDEIVSEVNAALSPPAATPPPAIPAPSGKKAVAPTP